MLIAAIAPALGQTPSSVTVGSKSFTESVILGEVVAHLARQSGFSVARKEGVGGTRLLWEALLAGQIDVYPEYTGTMSEEIFAGRNLRGEAALREELARLGLRMTRPLGFNNTYALGMKRDLAQRLGIRTTSDLRDHPDLRLRFSNEFMQRGDGWPSLARRYRLPQEDVRGMEHALAYEALAGGAIDVTDLYSTDAKIRSLNLQVLEDDLSHFPAYQAVLVYRADLDERAPALVAAFAELEGSIDENAMIDMNAAVEIDGLSETRVAAEFVESLTGKKAEFHEDGALAQISRYGLEHVRMVFVSLFAATLAAIPLGVLAARHAALAQPILGVVGIIQTIPAIALLVLLIHPVGAITNDLGFSQTVVALFLYSLLPIVRNTYTGLVTISPHLRESALALGLPPRVRLWRIELPLASRTILAGIKTAAVINVGFATLGGLIGAGGFGDPIFAGIRRRDDFTTLVIGAIPAAVLALLVQGLFELIERRVVPRGLRLKADG